MDWVSDELSREETIVSWRLVKDLERSYDHPDTHASREARSIPEYPHIWFLGEKYLKFSYPDMRRKGVTKDSSIIPRIPRQKIYEWDESPDRRAGGELSDIPVSCLWMCLPQASRPDDVGTHEWSEGEMRFEIPQIAPSIPLATSLAVSLYPEARRWTETREYQCREVLW